MSEKKDWWQPALILFSKLSAWIAGPVIIAVFVGKWLDTKYSSEPFLFLSLVGIAFLFSMNHLIKETLKYFKEEKELKNKNSKDDKC